MVSKEVKNFLLGPEYSQINFLPATTETPRYVNEDAHFRVPSSRIISGHSFLYRKPNLEHLLFEIFNGISKLAKNSLQSFNKCLKSYKVNARRIKISAYIREFTQKPFKYIATNTTSL